MDFLMLCCVKMIKKSTSRIDFAPLSVPSISESGRGRRGCTPANEPRKRMQAGSKIQISQIRFLIVGPPNLISGRRTCARGGVIHENGCSQDDSVA